MSEHHAPLAETNDNADSRADAKAIVALVAILVVTVCFWLLGQ